MLSTQIPDDVERRGFIEESNLFAWHGTLDAGRSLACAIGELSDSFPAYAWLIERWGELYMEMVKQPIAGSLDIVVELHDRGIPLFVISNFPNAFWPAFKRKHAHLFGLFEDIVVSGEVGVIKPDPAIFKLAMRRFNLEPSNAIFVDDMQN